MSAVPGRFQQGTLRYEQHTDELAALAKAIDLLGHQDIVGAIEVLMALRNHLQDSQQPRVVDYDPQHPGARP